MPDLDNLIKDLTDEIFGLEASKSPRLMYYEYDDIEEIVLLTLHKLQERGLLKEVH